jgi:hypothetical protein
MSYRATLLALILLALAGCATSDPPTNPQIVVNRDTVGFGSDSGFGAYVGTSRHDSIDISNGGIQDLIVTSLSLQGDNAFTYATSAGPLPITIKGLQHMAVSFYFAPTAARAYSGTFTIASNAANAPSKMVTLRGQGLTPPP